MSRTPSDGSRPSLATGGGVVSLGLLVLGISSYGFLTVAARGLEPADFSALAAMWSLVYAIGPGLFNPLEQEATRAVAERVNRGEDVGPVVRRVATLGALGAALAIAVLALAHGWLAGRVLGGHGELLWALAATLLVMAGVYVSRGLLAGTGRYCLYGGQLAGEGVLRVMAAVALAAAGLASAYRLGVIVAAAPLCMLTLTVLLARGLTARGPLARGLTPGGAAERAAGTAPRRGAWSQVTANLGWLVVASVISQVVANAGPIVLQVLGPDDRGLAGRFLAAFVFVRLPLFFASALQAALLPRLVDAVEAGDEPGYRRALGSVLALVGGLGAVGLAGLAALGPDVLALFFGQRYTLGRWTLVVLGASSVLYLLAAMLQSAVVALSSHRTAATCWVLGGLVFAGGCLLPVAPLTRLELAYTASGVSVPLLFALALARRGRRGRRVRRVRGARRSGALDAPGVPHPGHRDLGGRY